jgi:hypothetical protein
MEAADWSSAECNNNSVFTGTVVINHYKSHNHAAHPARLVKTQQRPRLGGADDGDDNPRPGKTARTPAHPNHAHAPPPPDLDTASSTGAPTASGDAAHKQVARGRGRRRRRGSRRGHGDSPTAAHSPSDSPAPGHGGAATSKPASAPGLPARPSAGASAPPAAAPAATASYGADLRRVGFVNHDGVQSTVRQVVPKAAAPGAATTALGIVAAFLATLEWKLYSASGANAACLLNAITMSAYGFQSPELADALARVLGSVLAHFKANASLAAAAKFLSDTITSGMAVVSEADLAAWCPRLAGGDASWGDAPLAALAATLQDICIHVYILTETNAHGWLAGLPDPHATINAHALTKKPGSLIRLVLYNRHYYFIVDKPADSKFYKRKTKLPAGKTEAATALAGSDAPSGFARVTQLGRGLGPLAAVLNANAAIATVYSYVAARFYGFRVGAASAAARQVAALGAPHAPTPAAHSTPSSDDEDEDELEDVTPAAAAGESGAGAAGGSAAAATASGPAADSAARPLASRSSSPPSSSPPSILGSVRSAAASAPASPLALGALAGAAPLAAAGVAGGAAAAASAPVPAPTAGGAGGADAAAASPAAPRGRPASARLPRSVSAPSAPGAAPAAPGTAGSAAAAASAPVPAPAPNPAAPAAVGAGAAAARPAAGPDRPRGGGSPSRRSSAPSAPGGAAAGGGRALRSGSRLN